MSGMTAKMCVLAGAGMLLAGCFTVHETEYPESVLSRVEGDVKVHVEGFMATVVTYTPVYSTETSFVSGGGPHRHHRRGGYYGPRMMTTTTETLIPTVQQTDVFMKRAQSRLEEAGCILRAAPSQYAVSGEFGGPFNPEGANWRRLAVDAGSVLFALYDTASYTLEVKVYDAGSGKPLFAQNYEQTYSAAGFSPLWLFGMAAFEKINTSYQQSWCLNALVDRATADVSAFLSQRK